MEQTDAILILNFLEYSEAFFLLFSSQKLSFQFEASVTVKMATDNPYG